MTRWLAIIPLLALIALGGLGIVNLLREQAPSAGLSDGRPAPTQDFPALTGPDARLKFAPPPEGKTVIVNLFASWCAPCRVEHPLLMDIAQSHPDRLYGLLYKDSTENGIAFLEELGDPFRAVGLDSDGQGGLDFGLTGVPETFVIDANGKILRHVRGPLDVATAEEIRALLE